MTDFSKLLNPEQLEAATAPDGPLLILAAAGTGKTRTLVYRVAYLVEKGVQPENILLLTFTNKAAKEMLSRAHEVAGPGVSNVWGGTFHHVANKILRHFAPAIGFPQDFSIIDSDDQRLLMGSIFKDNKIIAKEFMKREMALSLLSGARNRGKTIEDFIQPSPGSVPSYYDPELLIKVCESYERKKAEQKLMDFDDLLIYSLNLLKNNESVREYYQNLFRQVLVDEYQDTNVLQSEFVEILAAGHNNLSVVGDDFQCIYTWRGADFRNIMDFPKKHPGTRIVKLERNYRSLPGILEVANACIAGNSDQFQKTLRPTREGRHSKPSCIHVLNGSDQASSLINMIRQQIANGYSYKDMAVLYRSHFHSIELQLHLRRERIPNRITSGLGIFEQSHSKDLLAFFKLAEKPDDRLSFDRIFCMMRGAGPSAAEKAWIRNGKVYEVKKEASRIAFMESLPPKLRSQWASVDKLFADYANCFGEKPDPVTFTEELIKGQFYSSFATANYDNAIERFDDMRELATMMRKSESINSFLSEVALYTNLDREAGAEPNENLNEITLSTVHQAKGLEWPIIFIIWAVEGMFPSAKAISDSDNDCSGDAEERRLFYVAVTRAKDLLFIYSPQYHENKDGSSFGCSPSRFITEIPPECLETTRIRRYEQRRYF